VVAAGVRERDQAGRRWEISTIVGDGCTNMYDISVRLDKTL
jgi:hypothetical protein